MHRWSGAWKQNTNKIRPLWHNGRSTICGKVVYGSPDANFRVSSLLLCVVCNAVYLCGMAIGCCIYLQSGFTLVGDFSRYLYPWVTDIGEGTWIPIDNVKIKKEGKRVVELKELLSCWSWVTELLSIELKELKGGIDGWSEEFFRYWLFNPNNRMIQIILKFTFLSQIFPDQQHGNLVIHQLFFNSSISFNSITQQLSNSATQQLSNSATQQLSNSSNSATQYQQLF